MKRPDSSTSPRRSFSSGMKGAYCALTSTSGICTAGGLQSTEQEPCRGETHDGDHSVVDPTEISVYPVVAGSDTPAGACEGKAPDRRARQRQHGVPDERRAEDTGGDRDERADD